MQDVIVLSVIRFGAGLLVLVYLFYLKKQDSEQVLGIQLEEMNVDTLPDQMPINLFKLKFTMTIQHTKKAYWIILEFDCITLQS